MPKHYSTGLRKPNCQMQASHTSWWNAFENWGRPWSPSPHSLTGLQWSCPIQLDKDNPIKMKRIHWVSTPQEYRWSRNLRAWVRGAFGMMRWVGCPKPMASPTEGPLATLSPRVKPPPEGTIAWLWAPLPGFADIANTLWGRQSPWTPPELMEEWTLTQMVGYTLFVSQMVQDRWGTMSVYMVTCQLRVMGMEPAQPSPMGTISEMPTLEDSPKD